MLSIISNKNAYEQIEIVADNRGIDDLIQYLKGVKKNKDHMHLFIDSELDDYPITEERINQNIIIKHVRLQYASSAEWDSRSEQNDKI